MAKSTLLQPVTPSPYPLLNITTQAQVHPLPNPPKSKSPRQESDKSPKDKCTTQGHRARHRETDIVAPIDTSVQKLCIVTFLHVVEFDIVQ
jgi:hypothetical protein